MSITDELRAYIGDFYLRRKDVREKLYAIADRIDEAHTRAIGYVDDRDPETMAENGWVKLPTDANGELWRVGDMAKSMAFPLFKAKKVCGTGVLNGKPAIFYASKDNAGREGHISEYNSGWDYADGMFHYHEPTVEDVLYEFADVVRKECIELATISEETIAKYAAQVRLAAGEKEE